jgi:hypothetical protein
MRMALMRATVFAALIGSMFWIPAEAGASGGFGAATNQILVASPGVSQGQQPSPTDAPTGPTPAPTGTATPAESSPPSPAGPSNTGTAQNSDGTALVIGAAIILIVLLVVFYLWRRRRSLRDL